MKLKSCSWKPILRNIIFFMLSLPVLMIYSTAAYESLNTSLITALISLIPIAMIIYGIFVQYKEDMGKPVENKSRIHMALNILSVLAGTILVYLLHAYVGLNAVVASGLTGIIAAVVSPGYAAAVFCGSFVGMSSGDALNFLQVILAGSVTSVIFIAAEDVFNGIGGKLGTMAFTGCVLTIITTGTKFIKFEIPGIREILFLMIFSIMGAVLTYLLHTKTKCGPVLASGLVGMTAGLLMPLLFKGMGSNLAIMVYFATFAGMSSKLKVPSWIHMAAAGLICSFAYIFTPGMNGAGGKLGTIAFGSVFAVIGFMSLKSRWFQRKKREKVSVE